MAGFGCAMDGNEDGNGQGASEGASEGAGCGAACTRVHGAGQTGQMTGQAQ